jgi:hypothetical protein
MRLTPAFLSIEPEIVYRRCNQPDGDYEKHCAQRHPGRLCKLRIQRIGIGPDSTKTASVLSTLQNATVSSTFPRAKSKSEER